MKVNSKRFSEVANAFTQETCDVIIENNVAMKTRDGVTLRADVYRPKAGTSCSRFESTGCFMRVAIASVMQESNSFAPRLSSLSDFQIDVGPELARVYRGTNTEIGGFLEELEALGLETVPLLSAWALAAGPVEEAAFERV